MPAPVTQTCYSMRLRCLGSLLGESMDTLVGSRMVPLFSFTAEEWSIVSAVALRFVAFASWAMATVQEIDDLLAEAAAEGMSHP